MLANADVELRLTNRGAAISDAVLLNHTVGTNGQRVVLNGPDRIPIGAIVQQPDAPALAEYTVAREADGSVQFEHKMPEGLTISKNSLSRLLRRQRTITSSKWRLISGTTARSPTIIRLIS